MAYCPSPTPAGLPDEAHAPLPRHASIQHRSSMADLLDRVVKSLLRASNVGGQVRHQPPPGPSEPIARYYRLFKNNSQNKEGTPSGLLCIRFGGHPTRLGSNELAVVIASLHMCILELRRMTSSGTVRGGCFATVLLCSVLKYHRSKHLGWTPRVLECFGREAFVRRRGINSSAKSCAVFRH